jgi:putative mRNA 3-end processing factor
MAKISILGAGQEVGRSAIMLNGGGKTLLMDAGIKVRDQDLGVTGFPNFSHNMKIDATLVCHAHLDHSGYFPFINKEFHCPIFGTTPTQSLVELLINDAKKVDPTLPFGRDDIESAYNSFIGIPYGLEHTIGDIRFTLHDAGHIPGSAIAEVKIGGKRIAYTSDFKYEETRLHTGAKVVADVDVLITESTYARREHRSRKDVEHEMIKTVKKTLHEGGNVLFPTFAVGRTQELAMVLKAYNFNVPIYIDGMGRTASEIILNYPRYIKNPGELKAAINNLIAVGKDKTIPTRKPSIIIATSGMMEGGPALTYLLALDKKLKEQEQQSSVVFTGYCVEETNGWFLQNKQMIYLKERNFKHKKEKKAKPIQIGLSIHNHHLSAHAGEHELYDYIEKASPDKVICVHGDDTPGFAADLQEKGYNAVAPKNGEIIEI